MKFLVFLLFTYFSLSAIAQRPEHISVVQPKVDSIQNEADLLYAYGKPVQVVRKLAAKENKKFKEHIIYQKNDTIKVLLINSRNYCVGEYKFYDSLFAPIKIENQERKLTTFEKQLLSVKQLLIKEVKQKKYGVSLSKGYDELHYILFPYKKGYKLYVLNIAEKENTIPFYKDHLFIVDNSGFIQSHTQFHQGMNNGPLHLNHGEDFVETTHFSLACEDNNPYIYAVDIFLYRMHCPDWWTGGLNAHSARNKRKYTYNRFSNKIKIHLHPIEKTNRQ